MRVAVVGFQGDVDEHVVALKYAANKLNMDCKVFSTRKADDISKCDGVVLPGGESTTISRLIFNNGVYKKIEKLAESDCPIMGTCAGLILLAKYGDEQTEKTGTQLLGLMDTKVNRNAFGRQRESFQVKLDIKGIGNYNAIFIRAPAIVEAGKSVEVLATFGDLIVGAKQGKILAFAFHPELTEDTRIHEYFLNLL